MGTAFCAKCVAESSDESAGSYREGMFGREFRGHARGCPDCGSYVATLWRQFLYFPTSPVGTYRYMHLSAGMGGVKFLSRKLPLDAEQVRKTRVTGTLAAIAVLCIVAVLIYLKEKK